MRTYLTIWLNSEGETPMDITKKLNTIGFEELHGNYDFAYKWDKNPKVDDLMRLGNTIQKTLKGSKTLFKMETI